MAVMLLSRVAERIYWAARYLERAEDTARVVRAHTEMFADLPRQSAGMWRPLIAVVGGGAQYDARFGEEVSENTVVSFLLSDHENGGSVVSCVPSAVRTTAVCASGFSDAAMPAEPNTSTRWS